jgi:hypothetical protein
MDGSRRILIEPITLATEAYETKRWPAGMVSRGKPELLTASQFKR